jgi:hypothetical protein
VALLIEGAAEARGGIRTAEPTPGILALLDAAVVLLDAIVQGWIAPMRDLFTERFADGPRIRIVPIRCHPFGCLPRQRQRRLEEPLGCGHITLLTEQ